jgi:hypothetical protein
MLSGRAWQAEQRVFGTMMPRTIKAGSRKGTVVEAVRVPVITVVEVTHGVNGWHVHLHMLLLVSGDVDAAAVSAMGSGLFGRWAGALEARGLPRPNLRHGKDFRLLEGDPSKALGEYFTKSVYSQGEESVMRAGSMEVARGDFKDGRHGNRTPFGILRGLVDSVLAGDLGARSVASIEADEQLWHDWEAGSARRHQIEWSGGLREFLAVAPELSDEEIVDTDLAGDESHKVTDLAWSAVRRARAGARLLDAFEAGEYEGWVCLARFEVAGFEWESRHQPAA